MEIEFLTRNIQSNDWATIFFTIALGIIGYNRWIFTAQFADFSKLLVSDKYIKMYREEANLKSWFTISMTFIQFLSLSFFIHVFLSKLSHNQIDNFVHFIQILNILSFLVIAKYLIEKIVAICFNLEEFVDRYSLIKVNYRSYMGLFLLPLVMIFFYNPLITPLFLYITAGLIVLANIFIYFLIIKMNQKYIGPYFYYFILYLCTFEIAPYYILYKWYLNSGI